MSPDTDLTVGTEIEYPRVQPEHDAATMELPAHGSSDVRNQTRDDYGRSGWPDGFLGSDPTAGLELRSDPMSPDELAKWYRMSIAELSKYAPHEPTGITENSSASTIGLHLHASPLDEETARFLFELSTEPWFRIFACSSIAEGEHEVNYQLFRGAYCNMSFDNSERSSNDCVTLVESGNNHWEWRLLEPITPDHFDLVIEFIKKLAVDHEEARAFARTLVESADPRLTAIKRAEKIGVVDKLSDAEDNPLENFDVARDPIPGHSDLFNMVRQSGEAPYIYRVTTDEGGRYYAMYSDSYGPSDEFEFNGVEFGHDTVLDPLSASDNAMETVGGEQAELVREAVNRQRNNIDHPESPNKSEATDVLIEHLTETGRTATVGGGDD